MIALLDLTKPSLNWLQYLDSQLSLNLDDELSILLYNREMMGSDSWIEFMTQVVATEGTDIPVYELIPDTLEEELAENIHDLLNNPIDDFVSNMGLSINKIEKVKIGRLKSGDITVMVLADVLEE